MDAIQLESRGLDGERERAAGRSMGLALPLGAVLVVAFACRAVAVDVDFRHTATVSTSTVLLKDVADISGADPATIQRLQHVKLAPAPAPGRRIRLDFDEIRSRVEATGIPTADINYSGSSVVIVASEQIVDAARPKPKRRKRKVMVSQTQQQRAGQVLTDAMRHVIQAKYQQAGSKFLEVVVEPEDVPVVFASASEGFEFGPMDPRATKPQNIEVRCQDAQGQPVAFHVQCILSERPQVPVLTRSVLRGEIIRESDLTWEAVDHSDGLLVRVDQIVDKEAKKSIHAGQPIQADAVRSIPLVRSNDIVTGFWKSGGIRIVGQFKSRNDGALGEVVTLVKLSGSNEQVLARVTDVHEAQILDPDATPNTARSDNNSNSDEGTAPIGLARYSSMPQPGGQIQPLAHMDAAIQTTRTATEVAGDR